MEARQGELEARVAEPDFYRGDRVEAERVLAELAGIQAELEAAYERWAALEDE